MQRATQAVKANPRFFSFLFLLPIVTDDVGVVSREGQETLYGHLSEKTEHEPETLAE